MIFVSNLLLIVFVANVRVRFAGQAMFDNLGGGTPVGTAAKQGLWL